MGKKFQRTNGQTVSFQKNIRCYLTGCGCSRNSFIWVSDELQFIYFEIPKTGSTSLKNILCFPHKKYGVYQFFGSPREAVDIFPKYYKFAIIRNPYERMISNYRMFILMSQKANRHLKIEALFQKSPDEISFEEFLFLSKLHKNHHWEQCIEYMPTSKTEDKSELILDKVGRLERLQEDWKEIQRELGIHDGLLHKNSTKQVNFKPAFSDEIRKEIDEQFSEDIKIFNFQIP